MEYKQKKARTDIFGNVLKKGELYSDSKSLYIFRYRDIKGIEREVSSKDLDKLRKKERHIEKDLQDGINTAAGKSLTLDHAFDSWKDRKTGCEQNTLDNYIREYDNLVRDTRIGKMKLVNIRKTDLETHFKHLAAIGKSKNTIRLLKVILNQVFEDAADNDIIRRNPIKNAKYEGKVKEVCALTQKDQDILFSFLENSPGYEYYKPFITFAIETGLREGELTGLTWDNVNSSGEVWTLEVNHQLKYGKINGSYQLYIKPYTKTKMDRTIPISEKAKQALIEQQLIEQRLSGIISEDRGGISVDGMTGFIWMKKSGGLYSPASVNFVLKNIVSAYNKIELAAAAFDKREPELLPHIHAHMLRHTFSSNRNRNGADMMATKELMGHKHIQQTQDYTHIELEDLIQDVKTMDTKILKIG